MTSVLCQTMLLFILGLCPALAQAASITFTWDRWTPGQGDQPQGYIMQRKSGAGVYAEVGRPASPPFTDTLTANATTCWQVLAYNQLATSLPSNEVCLNVPSAPVNLVIIISGPSAAARPIKATTTVRRRRNQ